MRFNTKTPLLVSAVETAYRSLSKNEIYGLELYIYETVDKLVDAEISRYIDVDTEDGTSVSYTPQEFIKHHLASAGYTRLYILVQSKDLSVTFFDPGQQRGLHFSISSAISTRL